jgi:hypothetical protein
MIRCVFVSLGSIGAYMWTHVCFSSGLDDGAAIVGWGASLCSSSWWTAMEKRRQKAGSRTPAMIVAEGWVGLA